MLKNSLRSVLILPYVALVLCLAVVIGMLSYRTGSNAILTVSETLLKETVSRISQAIDRHVVGSVATLEAAFPNGMAAPVDIDRQIDEIRTRFWIASSLHIDPNNYVYYGNQAGQAIGLYRYSMDIGELRLKFKPEEHRKFYSLDGINGVPRFELEEEKLFDPRIRPWYKAGLKSSSDTWTAVYIDFRTQDLVATRARHVPGMNGEPDGVVATDMSLRSLNDFVSNLDVSPNGIAFIIEPNGQLIASSCSNNVLSIGGKNVRVNAEESGNPLLSDVYMQLLPSISEKMDNQSPKTFFFTDRLQRNIHVAYDQVKDGAGLNWINVVAMPSQDFMGGIKDNVVGTIFIGVTATILVVLIGLSILHWVTKDIKILSVAVNKVGSGYREEAVSIQRKDEIGDLAKSFSAMQRRLQTDYLTSLPNRYAFEQYLKMAIEERQHGINTKPFAVLFVDLNDFKKINDLLGHDVGDQALIEFALRLKTNIRQNDFVARFAGDEFVIMVNDIQSKDDLEPIRTNIERALSAPLKLCDANPFEMGGAIGVALFPDDAETVEQLLIVADKKMYAHKALMKKKISLTGELLAKQEKN
jgi:diguanylate cyclase (GGDEF)-like protein